MTDLDSVVEGNSVDAPAMSGGIDALGAALSVTNSTVRGNSGDFGGGIYNFREALTVTASTVSANAAVYGGGIESADGPLTVTSSTISGNAARVEGGGLDIFDNAPAIRNTIVAVNRAPAGPDVSGVGASQGHNLIGDGTGATGFGDSDLVGTAANPIDPLLGPLQDNGGPTPTQALLPGSPAIDAGDDAFSPGPYDQRGPGYPRIVNGIIDIGAFEAEQAMAPTVTCSVAQPLLWPPNHRLVNVGLDVRVDPPDADLHVLAYANDSASPADAADIGPGTLELRATRQGSGRVYLIVVTATNAGGSSFDVCAVAVPHDNSPRSVAAARQQAAAAEAYYREFQTAPPGYQLLGEGPDGAGGAPSSQRPGRSTIPAHLLRPNPPAITTPQASPAPESRSGVAEAAVAAGRLLATWATAPVDGYFAHTHEEGFRPTRSRPEPAGRDQGDSAALDRVLMEYTEAPKRA